MEVEEMVAAAMVEATGVAMEAAATVAAEMVVVKEEVEMAVAEREAATAVVATVGAATVVVMGAAATAAAMAGCQKRRPRSNARHTAQTCRGSCRYARCCQAPPRAEGQVCRVHTPPKSRSACHPSRNQ